MSVPPKITPFEFSTEAHTMGAVAQLTCMVSQGDAPLSISWTFHGQTVTSHMGITTARFGERISMLSLEDIMSGHSGEYTCWARNEAGEDSYSAVLSVQGIHILLAMLYSPLPWPDVTLL